MIYSSHLSLIAANEETRALAVAMADSYNFESQLDDIRYLLENDDEMNDLDGKLYVKAEKKRGARQGKRRFQDAGEEENTSESELETENEDEDEEIIIDEFEMERRAKEAERVRND